MRRVFDERQAPVIGIRHCPPEFDVRRRYDTDATPLVAATALALAALITWLGLPHIRVRTYNKTHGDLRVIEVALMLSRSPFRPGST